MSSYALTDLPRATPDAKRSWRDYEWWTVAPFGLVHLLALISFFWGVDARALVLCLGLYALRMFGVTAGYHRYFSHRSFKTSRAGQFVLALLATSSSQKGVLWWAAHHRQHHRRSDRPGDVHSPRHDGFWYAHLGWIYNHTSTTHYERVRDLARFGELRLLDRLWMVPPCALGLGVFCAVGPHGFAQGFCLSTVLTWHATFAINSLAHMMGTRPFATPDDSRNSLLLALLTLGEGWHNNHHHEMNACRQGRTFWQLDVTYLILRLLAKVGLVWDLREPAGGAGGGARANS